MGLSEEVQYISLLKPLPLVFHGYVWPFILLYAILLGVWIAVYGLFVHTEAFLIGCAIIAALDIVTCLFCVWSVHVRCALTCSKVSTIQQATQVKVVPTPNNGFTELVPLIKQKHKLSGEDLVWFVFQKVRYVYEEGKFKPLEFPTSLSFSEYHTWKGYTDEAQLESAKQVFGKNKLDMTSPDFWSLFKERATAPFFVFQVFCVGLWCLDEYWYYSLFTLFMLVTFEAILVKQQQRNLSEIRKMGAKPFAIQVNRCGKWQKMSTEDLLPGDIVSIGRPKDGGNTVPCDILLLKGPCIVDEAMLTGESVPQMKEPLDDSIPNEFLDLERDSRLHVISGGTRILQHTPPSKTSHGLRAPDNGCIGYVLRTGFNTSQGKLLRTILYGVKRVTANNRETFVFIMFLLVFAVLAAAYVWINGVERPDRNRYKLFLECTLILTSVVPPELPIELSLAVNTSLIALAKLGIYCTEPFRIPFAGKVDVCCFDKTGTLTTDNLVIQGIAGLPSSSSAEGSSVDQLEEKDVKHKHRIYATPVKEAPFESQCVLASCHSLSMLDGELVGDPLEKVALTAVDWNLSKGDTVTPKRGRKATLKIIQRFHFSSALKRMSTISSMQAAGSSGSSHFVAVKGAPEVLREMFSTVPDNYDTVYTKLTRQGVRVLALGYRLMEGLSMREVHSLSRQDVEKELIFAGFIAIHCPLKEDSEQNIRCLHDSSHHVIMLTGDNPLTACHVARQLKISKKKTLILTHVSEGEWAWQSVSGATTVSMDTRPSELGKNYDLCLTGDGLSHLLTVAGKRIFSQTLPYVKIFARVSPKQKEVVVTSYKSLGYNTLMCGDGTNDVGALKHAHVGVALLSTVGVPKHQGSSAAAGDGNEQEKNTLARKPLHGHKPSKGPKTPPPTTPPTQPLTLQQQREKKLRDLMKKLEEETEPQMVRLGDASIASPFTSRKSSIGCICHVIKQGRCTLVTTLQMFKILALNALILAYSQSVLYLDGIKFSDMQATIQGFLLAGCFLFISRSKPLTSLSKEHPLPNIFNAYTILTVLFQFSVHFTCLVYLVQETKAIIGHSEEDVDLEKEFEQNELNSAVYLISIAMQISNFAVNYKGHPFMASLTENKPLLYSLLVSASAVFVLASGLFPDLSATLEIAPFTEEFRYQLLVVLAADFLCSYIIDRILSFFLGTAKLKLPL